VCGLVVGCIVTLILDTGSGCVV